MDWLASATNRTHLQIFDGSCSLQVLQLAWRTLEKVQPPCNYMPAFTYFVSKYTGWVTRVGPFFNQIKSINQLTVCLLKRVNALPAFRPQQEGRVTTHQVTSTMKYLLNKHTTMAFKAPYCQKPGTAFRILLINCIFRLAVQADLGTTSHRRSILSKHCIAVIKQLVQYINM